MSFHELLHLDTVVYDGEPLSFMLQGYVFVFVRKGHERCHYMLSPHVLRVAVHDFSQGPCPMHYRNSACLAQA